MLGDTPQALAAVAASAAERRTHSLPVPRKPPIHKQGSGNNLQIVLAQPVAAVNHEKPEPLPVGRAFETSRAKPRGRGLMVLAGQAAVNAGHGATAESTDSARGEKSRPSPRTAVAAASSPQNLTGEPSSASSSRSMHFYSRESQAAVSLDLQPQPEPSQALVALSQRIGGPSGQETWQQPLEQGLPAHFLEDASTLPPYKLPRNPGDVYQKQSAALMTDAPSSIVVSVSKMQAGAKLLPEPFAKSLKKLPAQHLNEEQLPPKAGPLGNPNEPVWGDLNFRLQNILQKQGRRAERRRKRRMRSKMLGGRSREARREGREGPQLRQYLDRAAASLERGEAPNGGAYDAPVETGEFLGKVHEQYLQRRERLENPRFQVRPTALAGVERYLYNMGEQPSRAQRVVRPVYMPPPNMSMEMV